jgi:hypothetical protein
MSAPAFGTAGAATATNAATAQIPVPASVAADDVIVCYLFVDNGSVTVTGTPAGFTQAVASPQNNPGAPPGHSLYVYWKRATGADAGTYDFTLSGSTYRNCIAIRYTGCVTTGTPIESANGNKDATNGSVSPPVSCTTTDVDRLGIFATTNWSGGAWTPPVGWNERYDTNDRVMTVDDLTLLTVQTVTPSATCAGSGWRTAWVGALMGITGETHSGTVAFDMELDLGTTGSATMSGTADYGLNLSLSATGSESGRRLDPVVELYEAALACLCAAVAENPNPPAHCAPRVGPEIAYDMGQYTDYCCEGLAYISLGDTWASSASFPEQDIVRQADAVCPPATWAQDFKLGIIRCSPTGDPENGEPPTDADWLAAATQNLVDAQSLRVAACCFRNFVISNVGLYTGMSVVINRQTQVTPNGGCVERYVTITVQFPNLDCSC